MDSFQIVPQWLMGSPPEPSFVGKSIGQKMKESFFGKFYDILNELVPSTSERIKNNLINLPAIVVIGAESSGKSSLLEHITKCPTFLRDYGVCTRMPIRLKLGNNGCSCYIEYRGKKWTVEKEFIMIELKKLNDEINVDSISHDEVIITILDRSLPTLELIDLPGVRTYPAELSEQTHALCEKYLASKNNIILCVAPATTPRLTSYYPIGLITKHNREKDTILVLTMSDRVQFQNIKELIVNRICNETDELKDKFMKCIAVVNRYHSNEVMLMDHDQKEMEWFQKNIIDCIAPNCTEEKLKKINDNITINRLITNLDELFSKFIIETWIPRTIQDIENKINEEEEKLIVLGPNPEFINDDALEKIYKLVVIPQITELLCPKIKSLEEILNYVESFDDNKYESYSVYKKEFLKKIYTENKELIFKTYKDYNKWLTSDFKHNLQQYDFDKVFPDLKLSRFTELNNELIKLLEIHFNSIFQHYIKEMNPYFISMYLEQSMFDFHVLIKILRLREMCINEVRNCNTFKIIDEPTPCEQFSEERENIISTINKYNNAVNQLDELRNIESKEEINIISIYKETLLKMFKEIESIELCLNNEEQYVYPQWFIPDEKFEKKQINEGSVSNEFSSDRTHSVGVAGIDGTVQGSVGVAGIDGTVQGPIGVAGIDGTITGPDGTVQGPIGVAGIDGTITVPDGNVCYLANPNSETTIHFATQELNDLYTNTSFTSVGPTENFSRVDQTQLSL